MSIERIGPLLLIGLLLATAAAADRIWLSNGNYLEGTAVELPNGDIEIRSALGTLTLPPESVERIERVESFEQEVERMLAELPQIDAPTLFELALRSLEAGARTLAMRLLWEVIALDPEHEEARRLLGFRRHDGEWVSEREYRERRGEILFRGEWMAPQTRAHILHLELLRAQALAEARRERARQAALDYELARLREARAAVASAPAGVPLFIGGGGAPLQPAVVVRPERRGRPVVTPAPSRSPAPAATPAAPPVRHYRGRLAPAR